MFAEFCLHSLHTEHLGKPEKVKTKEIFEKQTALYMPVF